MSNDSRPTLKRFDFKVCECIFQAPEGSQPRNPSETSQKPDPLPLAKGNERSVTVYAESRMLALELLRPYLEFRHVTIPSEIRATGVIKATR